MRYIIWNPGQHSGIWFSSRKEMHIWIKHHFYGMSSRTMRCLEVYRDLGYTSFNPSPRLTSTSHFACYGNKYVSSLDNYILSFLN